MKPESLLNFLLRRRPKARFFLEGLILALTLLLSAFFFTIMPEKHYWIPFMFMIYGAFVNHLIFMVPDRSDTGFNYQMSKAISALLSVVIPFYLHYAWGSGLRGSLVFSMLLPWALISYFFYAHFRMRGLMGNK
jgi:hypothetical protein